MNDLFSTMTDIVRTQQLAEVYREVPQSLTTLSEEDVDKMGEAAGGAMYGFKIRPPDEKHRELLRALQKKLDRKSA